MPLRSRVEVQARSGPSPTRLLLAVVALLLTSKGPHPLTRLSPHTCCMEGRSQGVPRQSFHLNDCDTVPPCLMILMPMAFMVSPAAFRTGRLPTRPQVPGSKKT